MHHRPQYFRLPIIYTFPRPSKKKKQNQTIQPAKENNLNQVKGSRLHQYHELIGKVKKDTLESVLSSGGRDKEVQYQGRGSEFQWKFTVHRYRINRTKVAH